MDEKSKRKLYRKPSFWVYITIIVGSILVLGGIDIFSDTASQITPKEQTGSVFNAQLQDEGSIQTETKSSNLSNDNYYINSEGNKVHSPAYSLDNDVPAGASARCRDGTYSFSQSRRGTCSYHGGVAQWL